MAQLTRPPRTIVTAIFTKWLAAWPDGMEPTVKKTAATTQVAKHMAASSHGTRSVPVRSSGVGRRSSSSQHRWRAAARQQSQPQSGNAMAENPRNASTSCHGPWGSSGMSLGAMNIRYAKTNTAPSTLENSNARVMRRSTDPTPLKVRKPLPPVDVPSVTGSAR